MLMTFKYTNYGARLVNVIIIANIIECFFEIMFSPLGA